MNTAEKKQFEALEKEVIALRKEMSLLKKAGGDKEIVPKIITEGDIAFMILEYELDDSKKIVLGASKKIGKKKIIELHEELYLETLSSLSNLVDITNGGNDEPKDK